MFKMDWVSNWLKFVPSVEIEQFSNKQLVTNRNNQATFSCGQAHDDCGAYYQPK